MKFNLILFLTLFVLSHGLSQVKVNSDVEMQYYCQIDSISPGVQTEYLIQYNFTTQTKINLKTDLTGTYTPTGTPIPCFRMTGTKETWLRTHVNADFNQYKIASGPSSLSFEDKWLVGIIYSEYPGAGNGASPNYYKRQIPLAYPYGNTEQEADRLEVDLMNWLDCKQIPYWPDSVYGIVGANGVGFCVQGFRLILDDVVYSKNPHDPNDQYVMTNAGSPSTFQHNLKLPFEIYRKENGAIYWGLDFFANKVLPPITLSSDQRIDDGYMVNRADDCDRPSGSSECWVATTDTTLCSYTLNINANEKIQKIWANNGTLIWNNSGSPYDPALSTGSATVQALSDSLNHYLRNSNAWGLASASNSRGATAGWMIAVNHTDIPFDSVEVHTNARYLFKKIGCRDYHSYQVHRNELGGIVNVRNEYGRECYMPENGRLIPCDDVNNYAECQVKGIYGFDDIPLSTTRAYDLSQFYSFNYIVLNGPANITAFDKGGNSHTFQFNSGYQLTINSPNPCKYLARKFISFTTSGSGRVLIHYIY